MKTCVFSPPQRKNCWKEHIYKLWKEHVTSFRSSQRFLCICRSGNYIDQDSNANLDKHHHTLVVGRKESWRERYGMEGPQSFAHSLSGDTHNHRSLKDTPHLCWIGITQLSPLCWPCVFSSQRKWEAEENLEGRGTFEPECPKGFQDWWGPHLALAGFVSTSPLLPLALCLLTSPEKGRSWDEEGPRASHILLWLAKLFKHIYMLYDGPVTSFCQWLISICREITLNWISMQILINLLCWHLPGSFSSNTTLPGSHI